MAIKLILDTDIGDDIDDAAALAVALGSPELELLGVTTVFGDAVTRARIARKLVRAYGKEVPVVAGAEFPIGGAYEEGASPLEPSQIGAVRDDAEPVPGDAAGFICAQVHAHPGEVVVATIGAMTNVAAALKLDPGVAQAVKGIYANAGNLPPNLETAREWNVRYDPPAAQAIAQSGAPWTVLGVDVCHKNGLKQEQFERLAAHGHASTDTLLELIGLYGRYKREDPNVKSWRDVRSIWTSDCSVLVALLQPEAIEFIQGRIEVRRDATMRFAEGANGPHRLAVSQAPEAFREEIMRRMMSAR